MFHCKLGELSQYMAFKNNLTSFFFVLFCKYREEEPEKSFLYEQSETLGRQKYLPELGPTALEEAPPSLDSTSFPFLYVLLC